MATGLLEVLKLKPRSGAAAPVADDERIGKNARRLIEALKTALGAELDAFAATRAEVDQAEPLDGARLMKKLDSDAHRFALRAETLRKSAAEGVQYLRDRGAGPYKAPKTAFDAQASPIPLADLPPADDSVGPVEMGKDGTLRLMLRTETADGMVGEMTMTVPRGDPRYAGFVAHLGGMKAGDAKPIPPFPEPEIDPKSI